MKSSLLVLFVVLLGSGGVSRAQAPAPGVAPSVVAVSVDVLHANPAAFQNATVALTGIERITQTEVGEGKYQLSLYGHGDAVFFEAILPFKWAVLAARSKTLYASVKDARATPPKLTLYGNALATDEASAKPKLIWTEPTP